MFFILFRSRCRPVSGHGLEIRVQFDRPDIRLQAQIVIQYKTHSCRPKWTVSNIRIHYFKLHFLTIFCVEWNKAFIFP